MQAGHTGRREGEGRAGEWKHELGSHGPSGLSAKGLCSPQGLSLWEMPGPGCCRDHTVRLDSLHHETPGAHPRAVHAPASEVCP